MSDAQTWTGIPEGHYCLVLGIELTGDGKVVRGRAPVRPELFAPGTRRIRTGHLATLVDLVAGNAPDGPVGPTLDLRIQVLSAPPDSGWVELTCTPLRVGRRFIVAETVLDDGRGGTPFARATTTFLADRMGEGLDLLPRPLAPMREASFDEFIGPTVHDAHALALMPQDRLANGVHGTLQGGVQAVLAEMAAEHALGGGRRLAATDLEIRYLGRAKVGPAVARAEPVAGADERLRARVQLRDSGAGDAVVSHVEMCLTPV